MYNIIFIGFGILSSLWVLHLGIPVISPFDIKYSFSYLR